LYSYPHSYPQLWIYITSLKILQLRITFKDIQMVIHTGVLNHVDIIFVITNDMIHSCRSQGLSSWI